MDTAATHVNRTIEYRADRWLVGWLPYTLLLSALGIWMATFEVGRHRPAGWVVLLIAGSFSAFLLYRLYNPGRSRLTLSTAGLQLHVRGADVLIPWREIQSVDTMDVKVRNWSRGSILFPYITFRDCTVAKVSRPFYEDTVHTPSVFMQGPGWEGVFPARRRLHAHCPASRAVRRLASGCPHPRRDPLVRLPRPLAPRLARAGGGCGEPQAR